jgi:hypothetical protein
MNSFETEELQEIARDYRKFHRKLRARKAQIWVPLFVVAELAGGTWPGRVRKAFMKLALDASEKPVLSPDQNVLMDAAGILRATDRPYLTSRELLAGLRKIDESVVYRALSDRQMAMLMTQALGSASVLTLGKERRKAKGWHAMPILKLADELEAILSPEDDDESEDEFDSFFEETEDES